MGSLPVTPYFSSLNRRVPGTAELAAHRLASATLVLGQKATLPRECVRHNCIEIVKLGLPAQQLADPPGLCDDRHRVAGPALRHAHWKIVADGAAHGIDHLQHREAPAVTAI